MKIPNPNWQVIVQEEQNLLGSLGEVRLRVPGYVQIDCIEEREVTSLVACSVVRKQKVKENVWSKGPETLRAEGYEVPLFERLPQGRYTWVEAVKRLAQIYLCFQ